MHKIFIKKQPGLAPAAAVALIVLISAMLTALMYILQFASRDEVLYGITNAGYIFLLNMAPVLFAMLFLFFLSGCFSFSVAFCTVVLSILCLTNRALITLRQVPLRPADLTLVGEALIIVTRMNLLTVILYILLFIAVIAACAVFIKFVRTRKFSPWVRTIGAVLSFTALFCLNFTVYSSDNLYERLPVYGSPYNLAAYYGTRGFVYSFIYHLNNGGQKAPQGYDKVQVEEAVRRYESDEDTGGSKVKPHIIMVLSEAFTDISENPNIDFEGFSDPLSFFKTLKNDAVSGHIAVPFIGGGTSDTEFEILTGVNAASYTGASFGFSLLNKETDSIARVLKGAGYLSFMAHPGQSWYYNRKDAYTNMGFDELFFKEYFSEAGKKGSYTSEEDTVNIFLRLFEEKRLENPGVPLFEFGITIQNHGPYNQKYGRVDKNFNTHLPLSALNEHLLTQYIEGLKDQDQSLRAITEYLDTLDEPAILVFFGDHTPSFSGNIYEELDYPADLNGSFEERLFLYKTPFIIWRNQAYKRVSNINSLQAAIGENPTISANYLGTVVLQSAGIKNMSPYLNFLSELYLTYPVITMQEAASKEGALPFAELDEAGREALDLYHRWQYYIMHD